MHVIIVIPARFGSSRLPGKPLMDILGKPMIQHVVERAQAVASAQRVIVATDDERIVDAVRAFGGEAVLTSPHHASGTDRLVEIMKKFPSDIYLNLQGDEPLIRPTDLELLIAGMRADPEIAIGTLYHAISSEEARNPHCVKIILGHNGDALYFSRALIPFPRDAETAAQYFKHVGVYAYRTQVLAHYERLASPMLEQIEKLEQLRWLHAGFRIKAFEVAPTGPGVDTPEGLEQVRALMAGHPLSIKPPLQDIRLLITDVDGVLTDGGIFYDASGESLKRFHARDGMGIYLLAKYGITMAVVSGRDSDILRKRLSELGISLARFNAHDKATACQELMQAAGVTAQQTAYIGDDLIDLPAFAVCGLSFAVADAPLYIRKAATHTLTLRGGEGAVREVVDMILQASGQLQNYLDQFRDA